MSGMANWKAKIELDIKDLQKQLIDADEKIDKFANEDRKVKLDIDTKTLESAIQKLDKMLDSLGNGTGDFKQFENLSKELSSIVSEVQNLSKAFGKVDDSGTKTLLSSIQNIDKSLSELSQNILSVNKNMSNMGGNTSGAVKQVENIGNAYKDATKETEKFADAQSKLGNKTNISSGMKVAFPSIADTKLDEAISSAKDLDKTLNQVDIPTDSFDKVLEKLDRTKSELVDIVKITRKSVSDKDGKFYDSYTLKDSRGSTEIYGVNSKTDKGQILDQNIVKYDAKKDSINNSKELLAIEKQITAEIEVQTKAQQKKWQALQKEDVTSQKKQNEAEAIKRNQVAYKELTDTIRQYSEVAKRVSSGKAEDGDLEKMTQLEEKISQLQKQPILSESQVTKSEKSLINLYNQLDKIEKKVQETNQTKVNNKFEKLSSYQGKVDGYNNTLARFEDGGWTSTEYLKNVNIIKEAVNDYTALLYQLRNNPELVSKKTLNDLNELENKIKLATIAISNMSAAEKGYDKTKAQKMLDNISSLLSENTKLSSKAKQEIQAYYNEIASGNPSKNLNVIYGEVLKIVNAEEQAGRSGKRFIDTLNDKAFYNFAQQLGTMFSFYDVINIIKQASSAVIQLNSDIIDLAKVSEDTSTQIYNDFSSYADIAKEIGGTISDTISATADWSRNGYNIPDSKELARVALLYKNVGDGIDIDAANESLISTLRGFQLEADQAEHIIDVFNEVDLFASYYSNVIALCVHMHIDSNYIG